MSASTTSARIRAAFHGAAYVHVDEDRGLVAVWDGAHTFDVYNLPDLVHVERWEARGTVGDRWHAREECERWFAELGDGDS